MAEIVIIGAGLTGLSAAYHLEKQGYFDYKLFEKESIVGGLCRTVFQDGFTFDYTGHLLHTSDPYFKTLLDTIVGLDQFNTIIRRSFIYSHNTYTRYPFQINLFGLPDTVIAECVEGFIKRNKGPRNPKTFYDWVLKNFGAGFGKHFFFSYQKKIFAYEVKKLSASWTGRFVPSTSLEQIIRGALHDHIETDIGYNAHFFYPKNGGIMSWVHQLAQQLRNPIATDYCVQSVDLNKKIVTFTNGHVEPFKQLISTMPLDILLTLTNERSSSSFKKAINKLECNSVVNFNLGVARPDISDKHWIYFPETQYPYYRLGFPHNFATSMAPAGCSSLYGEFAHLKSSRQTVQKRLTTALTATKKLLKIEKQDIITEKILYISHAYVIYNFWREQHLTKLLTELSAQTVHSVGRYGEWKYASMQEAILDGKKIAQQLLEPSNKLLQNTHKNLQI